jgi:hypothetical protein
MKIRLTVVEKIESKLKFVKILKDVSGLSLKESKDLSDYLCDNEKKTIELNIEKNFKDWNGNIINSLKHLKEELPKCGGKIILNSKEFERELKMLSLGLGELEEYSSFIRDYLDTNYGFLENILSKLKKEDLQELINEIEL